MSDFARRYITSFARMWGLPVLMHWHTPAAPDDVPASAEPDPAAQAERPEGDTIPGAATIKAPDSHGPPPPDFPDGHLTPTPHCNGKHGDPVGACDYCDSVAELATGQRQIRRRLGALEREMAEMRASRKGRS